MLNPLVILSLGGALHTMGHAIMVPLYWAVSGLLVLFAVIAAVVAVVWAYSTLKRR